MTTADVVNNTAGNVTVDVDVTDAETGEAVPNGPVEVYANDELVGTGEIVDGKATIVTNITEAGTYDIDVRYLGNENYTESNDLLDDVEVVGRESNITAEPGNTTLGNTTVNVTLVDPVTDEPIVNATVIVTLPNGTEVNGTTDENGTVEIPVDLPVGENNITVTYPGDDTYNGTNTTIPIDVTKRDSVTEAEVINNTAGNVTVRVNVTDAITNDPVPNGPVEIYVNDTIVGTGEIEDGTVDILTNITDIGTYDITIKYLGNENYTESEDLLEDVEVVGRESQIIPEVTNTTQGNTTIDVTLIDPVTEEPIPNATVIVTLPNGTEVEGTTDDNGTVTIPVDLPVGHSDVDIKYPGNEVYNGTNITVPIDVTPRDSVTDASVVNNTVGNVTIDVTVTDATTGKPVPNGPVTVKVNDTVIGTGEIVDGKATIPLNINSTGIHDIIVTYEGNENYTSSDKELETNIVPRDSQLDATQTENIVGNTQLEVSLKDSTTGEPLANKPVTISYNGDVIAEAITDEDGKVSVNVDLPAGTNDITVDFAGDDTYNPASTVVTMDVVKRNATLKPEVFNNTNGTKVVEIDVTDALDGNPVENGTIELTLPDGTTIYQDVIDGKAVFDNVQLPEGISNLTATLLENPIYNKADTNLSVDNTPVTRTIKIGEWKLVCFNSTPENNTNNNTRPASDDKPAPQKVSKNTKRFNNPRNSKYNAKYNKKYRNNRYNKPSWNKPGRSPIIIPPMNKAQYRLFIVLYDDFLEGDMSFSDFVAILKLNGIEIATLNSWNENGEIILDYDNLDEVPDTIEIRDNSGHLEDYTQSINKNNEPNSDGVVDSGDVEVQTKAPKTDSSNAGNSGSQASSSNTANSGDSAVAASGE